LFTLPLKEARRLSAKRSDFTPIGKIVRRKFGLRLIDKRGRKKKLAFKGFTHF
jgi:hypothetical protein